jgi:hypothetical protein
MFAYCPKEDGIYFDGNICNKYQFLKEVESGFNNNHCDYKGIKILNNRRIEYKSLY